MAMGHFYAPLYHVVPCHAHVRVSAMSMGPWQSSSVTPFDTPLSRSFLYTYHVVTHFPIYAPILSSSPAPVFPPMYTP